MSVAPLSVRKFVHSSFLSGVRRQPPFFEYLRNRRFVLTNMKTLPGCYGNNEFAMFELVLFDAIKWS
jgi:hypothetical protein